MYIHFLDSRAKYMCLDKPRHKEFLSIKKLLRRWVISQKKLKSEEWLQLSDYVNTTLTQLQHIKIETLVDEKILENEFGQFYSIRANYEAYLDLLKGFANSILVKALISDWDLYFLGNQLLFRHSSTLYSSYWFLDPLPGVYFSEKFMKFLDKRTTPFFKLRHAYSKVHFEDFFISEENPDCTAYFIIPENFSEDILFELEEAKFENEDELKLFRALHHRNAQGKVHLVLCVTD